MKGIVFTELMEMVDVIFGEEMMEDVLDDCDLESGGAYTSVGTYDYKELLQIVSVLSKKSDIPVRDLVHKYGHHLFFRFHEIMPQFFDKPTCAFEFLESVHDYIHVEVKKLYPDASLPSFETTRESDDKLVLVYKSQCPLADFAHGLMQGCADFYGEKIKIQGEDHNTKDEYSRIFTLTK